jgi:hypothetical protein
VPSASLVCEGFRGQAATTATGLGLPGLPTALVPGHVDVQSAEELRQNVAAVTVDAVIRNLTEAVAGVGSALVEPAPFDIVFESNLDEVNRFFYENDWSDGLPIVPPTPERVAEFLRWSALPAETELGVLLPDQRRATVWNVAVNGVMAGCRPEYMPILVAVVEAMADPRYGVEHSGNTPGAETLIILNGPLIKELGFNYEQGALRDGIQANTTIGRFWRLYLRNVAGFLHHRTDKGTFSEPHPRRDSRQGGPRQGRPPAAALRALPHSRIAVRALHRRLDQSGAGPPDARRARQGRGDSRGLRGVGRSGPPGAHRLPRGGFDGGGERRPAAHQCLRLRAQRHPRLPHDEAGPSPRGVVAAAPGGTGPLVPAQLASPDRLSPRLAASRLSSQNHVLGRSQPSTYDPLSPRLVARPLGSNSHVRLGLRPPSGLVWLAIWPGTPREYVSRFQNSLEAR